MASDMVSPMNWGDHVTGPPTFIALFAYGDVFPQTHAALVRDLCHASLVAGRFEMKESLKQHGVNIDGEPRGFWQVHAAQAPQDALVQRARAIVTRDFLTTGAEVLLCIDHDIEWCGPSPTYEGDLLHLARKCAETRGIVGAMVSKKTIGDGIASMWRLDGPPEVVIGADQLVKAHFPGSGLTAYHRDALYAVSETMEEVPPGYRPIFDPMTIDHPEHPGRGIYHCSCGAQWLNEFAGENDCPGCGKKNEPTIVEPERLALSEDWALVARARALGYESYISTRPVTGHVGRKVFNALEAQPMGPEQTPRRVIGLIHATRGRPELAARARKEWLDKASDRHEVIYIPSCDMDDPHQLEGAILGSNRGNVDAYNRAAYQAPASIQIFVQMHDDVSPPRDWNDLIAAKLNPDCAQVLHVSDGLPGSVNGKPHLIPIMICTRKWAERIGGLFHPDYISVFCDDDASEKAYREGAVIDARDLIFKHDWQGADRDETQRRSYSAENWRHGQALIEARRRDGYPDTPERWGDL